MNESKEFCKDVYALEGKWKHLGVADTETFGSLVEKVSIYPILLFVQSPSLS